jgi:SAM-dependent methyltransferase
LIFQQWIASLGDRALTILDVGGRYQPYRPLFGDRGHRYIGCDLIRTDLVNVVADGEALPFASEMFDVVVCTQVFEHFPNPHQAAREMHRVLKPEGALLMSVAACAPRFVDGERWRYLPGGIRAVLSPFNKVAIVPETSSIGGLLRTLNVGMHNFAHFRLLRKSFELTICPCLNLMGLALEKMKLTANDQFTPNYSVFAVK